MSDVILDTATFRPRSRPDLVIPLARQESASGEKSLAIPLHGLGIDERLVRVSFVDPSVSAFSQVALTAALSGKSVSPQLELVPNGEGRFSWTGFVPRHATHFELAPNFEDRLPALSDLVIETPAWGPLIGPALLRRPQLVVQAAYWWLLRKRLRARHRFEAAIRSSERNSYERWVERFDTLTASNRDRIRMEIATWSAPPLISILMPVHDPDLGVLESALASVRAQLYGNWQLCIADDASTHPGVARLLDRYAGLDARIAVVHRRENGHISLATNTALALAQGPFCAFLDHDDLLPEHALYEIARALVADPDLDLIYSDEDKVDGSGRRFEPHFKPDWNPELLFAQNYLNHLTVIRTNLVKEVGALRPGFEGSQDHDLLLRVSDRLARERVLHIPKVLYHWRAAIGSGTYSDRSLAKAEDARLRAMQDTIARRGWPHRVERGPHGFNRLLRALPETPPLVSIVIPTRDRAELLSVVLDGLLTRTEYGPLEIVIVDNDSIEPATHALFEHYAGEARVRVLHAAGPFNFSALSNAGAHAARGDVLLFLNNDVEVIEPGWLGELVSIASDPEVGAVGAKLLYPDGTLQHGGVVLGAGGIAGHSHLGLARDDPGYFARMVMLQQVSAVTGACLALRRAVFEEVGGFDERHLAVAFNDIDLCLRIGVAGYRVIWTPHAQLTHHESKSRGSEDTPEKRTRFQAEIRTMEARWGRQLVRDPFYNPNLSRAKANFRIG